MFCAFKQHSLPQIALYSRWKRPARQVDVCKNCSCKHASLELKGKCACEEHSGPLGLYVDTHRTVLCGAPATPGAA